MLNDNAQLPAQNLAEGFAAYAVLWAREQQASESLIPIVWQAAYETSAATSEGHACAMLSDLAASLQGTSEQDVMKKLLASGVVGTPKEPGVMPLILDDDGRIYLHRYFNYEVRLANCLLASHAEPFPTDESLREQIEQLFSVNKKDSVDWQRLAVSLALQNRLTIISGGPGTGKTTSVVNLLACLLTENPDCRIALTAPTGKAAARMQEAIRQRANTLPTEVQMRLPMESYTVHRLLGVSSQASKFRHHANNRLPIDVLIVDEASMLDLALATQLLEAVPQQARIILLGDKNQLSAVEAGAVFSEISTDPSLTDECKTRLSQLTGIPTAQITPPAPKKTSPLQDSVVWLSESYRFSEDSAISTLASSVSQGDADGAIASLQTADNRSLIWLDDANRSLFDSTWQQMHDGFENYRQVIQSGSASKEAIFAAFDCFRILCAMRKGPRGSEAINQQLSDHFKKSLTQEKAPSEWYPGRPVIVLRNDYLLQLFNGDIGIALHDEEQNLMVYFPDNESGFRAISPIRLPEHETAFAMTVHKSQGSEFDNILLLLPAQHHRVASRELLYTGITRARNQVAVAGSMEVVSKAVNAPIERRSGLIRRLEELSNEKILHYEGAKPSR